MSAEAPESSGTWGTSTEDTAPVLRKRYASMFRTMSMVAVASYGSYLGVFLALGVPVMPWVNLAATALCGLSLWLIRRDLLSSASATMALVVLGQAVPATLVLGWGANFHLFWFLYLIFALLNPGLRVAAKVAVGVAITLGYVALETVAPQTSALPSSTVTMFKLLNLVMFAGCVSFLALLYSASIWTVTAKLHSLVGRERHTRKNLNEIFANAPIALVLSRLSDGALLDGNQHAVTLFETPLDQAVGQQAPDFWHQPADRERLKAMVKSQGRVDRFEAELRTRTGRRFWAELTASVINIDGAPALLVGVADITARRQAAEQLLTLATTDGLTGAFNRRHFLELAEAELARAVRHGHPTSIAMFDLDHFKAINDRFGHGVGDSVLTTVSALVRERLRVSDVFGRVGGEEFALLLPETDTDAAHSTLERLRAVIEVHPVASRAVTVSIGLASLRPGDSLAELLKRADAALYTAKSAGRNRVVVEGTARDAA